VYSSSTTLIDVRLAPQAAQKRLWKYQLVGNSFGFELQGRCSASPRGVLAYATPRRLPFRLMTRYLSSGFWGLARIPAQLEILKKGGRITFGVKARAMLQNLSKEVYECLRRCLPWSSH
jgi:hypothetical protein